MSKTVTNYLNSANWHNRRSSMHNLSETNGLIDARPRSNSTDNVGYLGTRVSLRTPSPYGERKNFSYESTYAYDYDSPFMVVTGRSPSVLEGAKQKSIKKRRAYKLAIVVIILILVVVGTAGLVLSKALPRSSVYCFGKHFCIPRSSQTSETSFTPIHPRQIHIEREGWKNAEKRKLIPKAIPKVIGKLAETLEAPKNEPEESVESSNSNVFDSYSDDKFIEKIREINRMKKSRFMPQEKYLDNRKTDQWRDWENQWDNRPVIGPPGVNPRIYLRNDL